MSPPLPTRRSVLASSFAAVAIAATGGEAAPATASEAWSVGSWLERWRRLGCGVRLDAHGALQLTIRTGHENAASALMEELAVRHRPEAIKAALARLHMECPAVRAAHWLRSIEDQNVHHGGKGGDATAWKERRDAAAHKLLMTPAQTGAGMAKKMRAGLSLSERELGDRIVSQVLAQLERLA